MKIPLSWLKEHINTSSTPEQIAHTLTMLGLEVDAIDYTHLEEKSDAIFTLSLTPNLAHAASVRGVARELAASEELSLLPIDFSVEEKSSKTIDNFISVQVDEPTLAPRYCCRVIENVQVAPSPLWLKERIEASGMRSVNNVVDITNYLLLELGHPLHAFDLNKIAKQTIRVRKARSNEEIITLDNQLHYLTEEMLVIADGEKAIAVAGVMGSLQSEVSDETTTVVLESAYFIPTTVRRTSKHTGIQTLGSYHFERGCDPNGVREALDRAAQLIQEHCQGKVVKGTIDLKAKEFLPEQVTLRPKQISRLLGISLGLNEIEALLKRLDLPVIKREEDILTIKAPTYRHDIHAEIDLIEEIARLYGYQNLVNKKNSFWRRSELLSSPAYLFEKRVREILLKCNLQEIITCNLISPLQAELIPGDVMAKRSLISLLNPSSIDHSILRPSLLPGMVATLKHNIDHGVHSLALFETGRIHFKVKEQYIEPSMAAILLSGNAMKSHWQFKEQEVDFFTIKGMVEDLLASIHIKESAFQISHFSNLHPQRQVHILIGEVVVGLIGEIHPLILKKMGVTQRAFFAELNLEDLSKAAPAILKMQSLPLFPTSTRDWTISIDKNTKIEDIFLLIKKSNSSLLESVSLVDVYAHEKLGNDMVNATFHFVYRDPHKTVSAQEVEKEHNMITQNVLSGKKQ